MAHNILILGASYGSLLATKLLMAGQSVTLVCTRPTAELIERDGTRVLFPVKGRAQPVEIDSRTLSGKLSACAPEDVDPSKFDLAVLGMQEAHYGAAGVRELMVSLAQARTPCLAIMNMPPLAYLKRLPGVSVRPLEASYAHPSVWEGFDPALMTLASPDPQAFRPADRAKNVLQVGLPTNFKAAAFESPRATALLRELEAGIDAARFVVDGEALEIPVKLKVHDSVFVPLAKWPMLMAGNYRCVGDDAMISIRDAVHGDAEASRRVYEWTAALCRSFGAEDADLVPYEKYAKAAEGLAKPSSAARALFSGAEHIERVDRLVQALARQRGLSNTQIDEVVARVERRLMKNRGLVTPAIA
jgi:hypothetical protein